MFDIHLQLHKRFTELRNSRSGPIFFIEHGLSESEIVEVVATVGNRLNQFSLENEWWHANYLPLLVAATEVGYQYRGTGTNFWPVLEEKFGVAIRIEDRRRIGKLFGDSSKIYRGVRPPNTPWAKAFHIITWPITHALVPIEFHRPLALLLADLRVNVSKLDDAELYRAIRIAASSPSTRFSSLLEDEALVVNVTRMLLNNNNGEFCTEVVERISAAIASDQVSSRAVSVARRIQRSIKPHSKPPSSPSRIVGSLYLRSHRNAMSLEAVFPPLETSLHGRLQRALRRRRYTPKLWGVSKPVPSVQLLSSLPFTVNLSKAPLKDAALFPNLDQAAIDKESRDVLTTFELDVAPPLLFAIASDKTHARRIRGPSISGERQYWLLSRLGEGPRGCVAVNEVGPFDCHLLDPREESSRDILSKLGFQVRFGISVGFAGKPPIERHASTPCFAIGDYRMIVAQQALSKSLEVQLGEDKVCLKSNDVASFVVEPGDHTLFVSNGSEIRPYTFRGAPSSRTVPPLTCSIEPRSVDFSVQALLRGDLEIAFESVAPLAGLELTAEIEANSRRIFASAVIDPLPCSLSSRQEPFRTLLNDKEIHRLLMQEQSPMLRLRLGHLCYREVVLEQRVLPCWWQHDEYNSIVLTSAMGELPFGCVTATAPANRPTQGVVGKREEAQLLAPVGLDIAEYGEAAQFTTLCIAPPRMRLDAPIITKPRILRRRRVGGNSCSFEDVLEAYLRWSLADSTTILANLRRRQIAEELDRWATEICCGEEWVRHETEIGNKDPWEELILICDRTNFGRDSYIKVNQEDEFEVTRIAVHETRKKLPDLWARVGSTSNLVWEDYETLNQACSDAYTSLGEKYRKEGRHELAMHLEQGDPWEAPDQWDGVLQQVLAKTELLPLAEMLTPSDMAMELITLEPSMMTLHELTEELASWVNNARRALAGDAPTVDILKAILALWVEVEVAANLDWRSALNVLLVERSIARAARYLALRSQHTTRRDNRQ